MAFVYPEVNRDRILASGTFWVRSNARRGEMGLRMALGSIHRQIKSDLLMESWLLTTLAWLLGLPIGLPLLSLRRH